MVQRHPYDLMVLDLFMPQMDGYSVARTIRARESAAEARGLTIVAHSSEPAYVASIKARKAGMNGFVSKPASQLALVQRLVDALSEVPVQSQLAGQTVLVADDNAWSRRAVCAYLRQAGVIVVEAEHGAAAVQQMRAGGPWLAVLMDLHMPGMDGLQAAQHIRQTSGPGREIPIIAVTARSDQAAAKAAAEAGMDDFITKPIDAEELCAKLRRLAARTGVPPSGVIVAPPPPPASTQLLDRSRLENYRRLGLLGELVEEGLPELERLVDVLLAQGRRHDADGARETLHSLLGMAGEMGASALYQQVRQVYVPLAEDGRWLLDEGWLLQFAELTVHTGQALREQATVVSAAPT